MNVQIGVSAMDAGKPSGFSTRARADDLGPRIMVVEDEWIVARDVQQTLQSQKVRTKVMQATWSSPATNRLLFDAGFSFTPTTYDVRAREGAAF